LPWSQVVLQQSPVILQDEPFEPQAGAAHVPPLQSPSQQSPPILQA
jgi:hypothetical protein